MDINERLVKLENTVETISHNMEEILNRLMAFPQPAKTVEDLKMPVIAEPVKPTVTMPPKELIDLLNSTAWPHAVDPSLICDTTSEKDKEDRAEGILDLIIDIHLENLRFLDFGCGEGHVVNRSQLQKSKISVGYDIKTFDKWSQWQTNNILFTTDWNDVKKSAPYNFVLFYDVIDHMLIPVQEIIEKLKEIKTLLAPNGKVYVRTHPFCSRHGTHLYHQLNKAFVHLVFTEDELKALGYQQDQTRKTIHPIIEYQHIFNNAGLKIFNGPHLIREEIEGFFMNSPAVAKRIKENYKNSPDPKLRNGGFPVYQLEQQFLDYVLM